MDSSLDPRSITPAELVKTYVNNAADLLGMCDLCIPGTDDPLLLPGDRIKLFCELAANRPEVAFPAFMMILRDNADPTYRALALRGLRWIQHPETLQEMRACETETARELVQMLASELLGKGQYSNDLTRWAAADAIINLQYPPNILRGAAFAGLMESPKRIQQEITEIWLVKKERLQRFSSQGYLTVEYDRFLDFWTFGPVDYLFSERSLDSNDIDSLLNRLSWLGLETALYANAAATGAACNRFMECCIQYHSCEQSDRKKSDAIRLGVSRFFVDEISDSELANTITTIAKVYNQEEPIINFLKVQIKAETSFDIETWLETIEDDLKGYEALGTYFAKVIKFESLSQHVLQVLRSCQDMTQYAMVSRMLSALDQASPLSKLTEADLLSNTDSDFLELIEDLKIRSDHYYDLKEDILARLHRMFHDSTADVKSGLQRLTGSFQSRRNSELNQLNLLNKTREKLLNKHSQAEKTINVLLRAIKDLSHRDNSTAYKKILNDPHIQAFVKTWTSPGMSYIAQNETLLSVAHKLQKLSEVANDMSKHIQHEIDLISESIKGLEKSNPSDPEIKPFFVWPLMFLAFLFFTSFLAVAGVVVVIMPITYVVIRTMIHFVSLQWDKKIENHEKDRTYYQRLKDEINYESSTCKRLSV
jgi:hypothetical protein